VWHSVFKSAFTRLNLARASQVPEMRAQTFRASYGKFYRFNFEVSCDFHYSTCMKRLRAHPRNLNRVNQLAPCKRGLKEEHRLSSVRNWPLYVRIPYLKFYLFLNFRPALINIHLSCPFSRLYIIISLLRSTPELLNFHFEHETMFENR
jgi:hypothetical protein